MMAATDGRAPATTAPPPAPSARPRDRGRVLLVIRLLAGRAGGAERLFCDLASTLSAEGYDVTIATFDSVRTPWRYPVAPGVRFCDLWARRARWAPALGGAARALPDVIATAPARWLGRNAAFVHALHGAIRELAPDVVVSFLPQANTPALIAGRLAGVPVVPTNHNVPERDYAARDRWDPNPVDRFLRLRALHAADRIHVLFPQFAAWFPAPLRERIVAIPNAIAAELDAPPPRDLARAKTIVAAGRLHPAKNYGVLVEAWAQIAARHPDWSVRLHGDGDERPALERAIAAHGVAGSFHLMGHTDDIRRAYLEGEIFAHPALHEGFGLAVAEAITSGLPVVAFSDCAGVDQIVTDGGNGLLVDRAGGAAALAAGLERLITDASLRERLRAQGPTSLERFSRAAFRSRWTALLDDVIARRRAVWS